MRFPETEFLGVYWLSQKRKIMQIWAVYSDIQLNLSFLWCYYASSRDIIYHFVFKNINNHAYMWGDTAGFCWLSFFLPFLPLLLKKESFKKLFLDICCFPDQPCTSGKADHTSSFCSGHGGFTTILGTLWVKEPIWPMWYEGSFSRRIWNEFPSLLRQFHHGK